MGDLLTDPHSYHLVGISFFILGLGTLLPWNFFITAIPYFQGRLAGANATTGTLDTNHTGPADTFNFNNWVTLLSQLPLLLFTLLNSFLYQCVPETVRILGSLLVILLLFALTAALVKVDMSPGPFFSITMASVWFINSFCAVLQGSLFGQLGTMPSAYSTLFLSGQGLAGIFAALAMLMSMASGVDAQTSALGYFITPCVGIFLSIVCYLSLPHLEFARYYLAKKPSQAQGQELETKAELLQSDLADGAVPCAGLHGHSVRSWEVESVLQPHLLLPSLQHHGLGGTEPDLLLPVASPAVPAARPLPAGRLLHHLHAALRRLQRLPHVPHHVPGAQVWGSRGRAWGCAGGPAERGPILLPASRAPAVSRPRWRPLSGQTLPAEPPWGRSWGEAASAGGLPAQGQVTEPRDSF
uniref:Solute carrier family 29 member 2 n=1 Tax=Ursus maritimus TaxID=29073 RepID=A0A452U3E9_URSMA